MTKIFSSHRWTRTLVLIPLKKCFHSEGFSVCHFSTCFTSLYFLNSTKFLALYEFHFDIATTVTLQYLRIISSQLQLHIKLYASPLLMTQVRAQLLLPYLILHQQRFCPTNDTTNQRVSFKLKLPTNSVSYHHHLFLCKRIFCSASIIPRSANLFYYFKLPRDFPVLATPTSRQKTGIRSTSFSWDHSQTSFLWRKSQISFLLKLFYWFYYCSSFSPVPHPSPPILDQSCTSRLLIIQNNRNK